MSTPCCLQVVFEFIEKKYPTLVSFNVEGAKSLPPKGAWALGGKAAQALC
jgi:hypothetical protein